MLRSKKNQLYRVKHREAQDGHDFIMEKLKMTIRLCFAKAALIRHYIKRYATQTAKVIEIIMWND